MLASLLPWKRRPVIRALWRVNTSGKMLVPGRGVSISEVLAIRTENCDPRICEAFATTAERCVAAMKDREKSITQDAFWGAG